MGHCHFLKSIGDIGDPPSRAPPVASGYRAYLKIYVNFDFEGISSSSSFFSFFFGGGGVHIEQVKQRGGGIWSALDLYMRQGDMAIS